MKRIAALIGPFMLILCLVLPACRHLQKGETQRCPTCGVEYPAGTNHDCNHKKSE